MHLNTIVYIILWHVFSWVLITDVYKQCMNSELYSYGSSTGYSDKLYLHGFDGLKSVMDWDEILRILWVVNWIVFAGYEVFGC